MASSLANSSGNGFVTVRVTPRSHGGVTIRSAFVNGDDTLLGPPVVSPVGYSFLIAHGETTKLVRVAHLGQLDQDHDMDERIFWAK